MYVAPEVFLGTPHNNSLAYTPLVDSWSVGAIVYAELTMSVPFPDDDSNVDLKERYVLRSHVRMRVAESDDNPQVSYS